MEYKNYQKWIGLGTLIIGLISLILFVLRNYIDSSSLPSNITVTLIELISSIIFVLIGIFIIITKERNNLLNLGSIFILLSAAGIARISSKIPSQGGIRSMQGTNLYIALIISILFFLGGIIYLIRGKLQK